MTKYTDVLKQALASKKPDGEVLPGFYLTLAKKGRRPGRDRRDSKKSQK